MTKARRPRSHAPDHVHEPSAGPVLLRARGRRLTPQRTQIWEVLIAAGDRHLTADQIAEQVQERLPGIYASTVYRTLEILTEEGLVLRTDLGGARAYYEPAREHRHHHLVCEHCDYVVHFHDDVLGDLPARIESASGFVLGAQEVTLFGVCPACRAHRR
jgi:Fur family transcriptional regulator, ferric uptake regulator